MTANAREITEQPASCDVVTEHRLPDINVLPAMPLPDLDDDLAIEGLARALLPAWDREIYGYERAVSSDPLPPFGESLPIPILDVNLVLPKIVEEPVQRIYAEAAKQGPRLLGISPRHQPQGIVCVEFPPITVSVLSDYDRYVLQMPYIIELWKPATAEMAIAFAFEPMTVDHQEIYIPPLPHINGFGLVCIYEPPGGWRRLRTMEPLEQACIMMNHYWFTDFRYYNDYDPIGQLGIYDFRDIDALFSWWEQHDFAALVELRDNERFIPIPFDLQGWAQQDLMNSYMGARPHQLNWYLSEEACAQVDARHESDDYTIRYWNS